MKREKDKEKGISRKSRKERVMMKGFNLLLMMIRRFIRKKLKMEIKMRQQIVLLVDLPSKLLLTKKSNV